MPRLRKLAPLATVIALSIALLAACGNPSTQQSSGDETPAVDNITVAAASNLRPAFEEIATAFTQDTSTEVTLSFGASGQLATQLKNGAPFDVFAPASPSFIDDVGEVETVNESSRTEYAVGRIVLLPAPNSQLPANITELSDPQYRTIAIANPDLAPYGLAAKYALQQSGVWEQIENRVVYGQNIAATMEIIKTGNAQVGIVALSLAMAENGRYTLVPESLHDPLKQSIVVSTTGSRAEAAQQFIDYLASPTAQEILNRYGFATP